MGISKKNIAQICKDFCEIRHGNKFFFHLGDIIRDELSDLRLIGEIERPEGKNTYRALRNALKELFKIRRFNELDPYFFDFPEHRAVISLYFVWAGVFYYGSEGGHDFWPHVSKELGFQHNPRISPRCGEIFFQCLEENNLELFPQIYGGHKYVTRILLHGLIPDKHIRKFIGDYILGELSTCKARYQTGYTIINKWVTGGLLHSQPKPIQNFITYGHPINADLVGRFWEMIDHWDEDGAEFWRRWGLPKYMVDAFRLCVNSADSAHLKSKHIKTPFSGRPYLMFDLEHKDFPTLYIPSQPIEAGLQFRIRTRDFRGGYSESTEKFETIKIGKKLFVQGREIQVRPSTEWSVNLSNKSQSVVYQFPKDDSQRRVPIFLFNAASARAIIYDPSRNLPSEVVIVFSQEAHLKVEGGEARTEPMPLSRMWHSWRFAIYHLQSNGIISYQGPNLLLTNVIKTHIPFSREKENHDVPILRCNKEAPSWMRTDGNLSIIMEAKSLVICFSHAARTVWRRGMGRLIRLDEPTRQTPKDYFNLNLEKDGEGFVSKPSILKGLDPGVYEIRIRGALGVEDVILPFVYLPIVGFDKRGPGNTHGIANRFVLNFTQPTKVFSLKNTSIQRHEDNRAIIELEEDGGDAFCALKLFEESQYPVTLLLARSTIRWVRRSEEGLFHWYFWRASAEEIPIDRLDELQDKRVLIEIDTSESMTAAKINRKSNRLRVLLKSRIGEKCHPKILMSFEAPNFRRSHRDIWVLDLQKFADQMKSLKDSGHADLVVDTYGSYPEIILFSLLRYSEFKDFKIVSKGNVDKRELLQVTWSPHPNEARKNRVITFSPQGEGYSPSDHNNSTTCNIQDGKKPPLTLEIDVPERPGIWTARIGVRQSRFGGGRFAKKTPNAACDWLRMPEDWVDWPEIPDASHDKIPDRFPVFSRFLGNERAWSQMPWYSFLTLFHCGCKEEHIRELSKVLGKDLLKQAFPFSKGKIWQIRNESKTIARMRIVSDTKIESDTCNCFRSLAPSKWCQIPEGIEFEFCVVSESYGTVWCCMRPAGGKDLVIKNGKEKYSFSQWFSSEIDMHEMGIISPQIPLQTVWNNSLAPSIVNKTNCEDAFSYESLLIDDQLDGVEPIQKLYKHHRKQSTAMAEAFSKCMTVKKSKFDQSRHLFPSISPSQKKEVNSLITLWDEWSNTDSIHPLIRIMIRERLKQNPLNALSGSVALMSRFKAHEYWRVIDKVFDKARFESLLSDTQDFVTTYLRRSFLRDLILSEIIISWYWNKRYYEFYPRSKANIQSASTHPRHLSKDTDSLGNINPKDKFVVKVFKSKLVREPRYLSSAQVLKIWKTKGLYSREINKKAFFVNDYVENGDGTVADHATDLMWQKEGSTKVVTWNGAKDFIKELNQSKFAGYTDWRMPTLEELGSLLVYSPSFKAEIRKAYHISSVFSRDQIVCWSADTDISGKYWYVSFFSGNFACGGARFRNWVRAVRSLNKDN